ncbi:hypothetical protein [Streptomyces sp. NPDC056255]|uniref:hypothetical protein n=1 Tax=Streptomyces sp. NPDC056255 TaxID=3345764 RepID=UPI0035E39EE0
MKLAREIRSSGVAVTLVVHEHKRFGRSSILTARWTASLHDNALPPGLLNGLESRRQKLSRVVD